MRASVAMLFAALIAAGIACSDYETADGSNPPHASTPVDASNGPCAVAQGGKELGTATDHYGTPRTAPVSTGAHEL